MFSNFYPNSVFSISNFNLSCLFQKLCKTNKQTTLARNKPTSEIVHLALGHVHDDGIIMSESGDFLSRPFAKTNVHDHDMFHNL